VTELDDLTILDITAHVVRSVVPVWAAASDDIAASSTQGGGMSPGWEWEALGPKVTASGRGWSRTWPRGAVCAVVRRVRTDSDVSAQLDRWRALRTEHAALLCYDAPRGNHVATDPARAAVLDREMRALRSAVEDAYARRAAAELLGVSAQLSLFEAAS
jgi:hypothetical protein